MRNEKCCAQHTPHRHACFNSRPPHNSLNSKFSTLNSLRNATLSKRELLPLNILRTLIDIESVRESVERIAHVSHPAYHTALHVVDIGIDTFLQ